MFLVSDHFNDGFLGELQYEGPDLHRLQGYGQRQVQLGRRKALKCEKVATGLVNVRLCRSQLPSYGLNFFSLDKHARGSNLSHVL